MGRPIWVEYTSARTSDGAFIPAHISGPMRVLSMSKFLPADPPGPEQKRKKHLVQLWTDPGGMRTLSVGSIRLKDPGKVAGALARAERERAEHNEYTGWPSGADDETPQPTRA